MPFSDKLKKRQFQIVYSFLGGNIRKLFDGRNAVVKVMILFSILFDKVHIASGFMYMAAERVLFGGRWAAYTKSSVVFAVWLLYTIIYLGRWLSAMDAWCDSGLW